MGKIAFVFSGQGAQYPGMGKELYEISPAAKKLYDDALSVRADIADISFSGTEEELKITKNTQPALYLVDLAAARAAEEAGIKAGGAAGFSLGEIAALAFSGAYSDLDGFEIVNKRGALMNDAAEKYDTAMTAVLKLDKDTVIKAAGEFEKLYAVNFNCPGQTVVSGLKRSMPAFEERIKELGGRCVPLAVSAAFHSPFMAEAAEAFGKELSGYDIKTPAIPVYANRTALPYQNDIKTVLKEQMENPVKWQETIENMINDGFDTFIETGAGKTLSGLIRKISKDVKIYNIQDKDSLIATREEMKNNA